MPGARRFVLVVLLLFPMEAARATVVVFQNGVDGYAGSDNQSYSFDGLQSFDTLSIDYPSFDQPQGRYAWLVFADVIGPDAIPAGTPIRKARVEGWVSNPFGSATIARLLRDIADRPPWITAQPVAGTFYDDTQTASTTHPSGCETEDLCDPPLPTRWDVTAIVQSWVDGAPNYGFLILPETTDGGNLVASDDPDVRMRPRLLVTVVPEPARAAMAVGALVALRALHARKVRSTPLPPSRP